MWVVQDVVRTLRHEIGVYGFWEWPRCLEALGMEWHLVDIPYGQKAFITDDIVFLDRRLRPFQRAFWVWHELGHQVLHEGCALWWRARPQGYISVAKFERQANEFVALFPDWGE